MILNRADFRNLITRDKLPLHHHFGLSRNANLAEHLLDPRAVTQTFKFGYTDNNVRTSGYWGMGRDMGAPWGASDSIARVDTGSKTEISLQQTDKSQDAFGYASIECTDAVVEIIAVADGMGADHYQYSNLASGLAVTGALGFGLAKAIEKGNGLAQDIRSADLLMAGGQLALTQLNLLNEKNRTNHGGGTTMTIAVIYHFHDGRRFMETSYVGDSPLQGYQSMKDGLKLAFYIPHPETYYNVTRSLIYRDKQPDGSKKFELQSGSIHHAAAFLEPGMRLVVGTDGATDPLFYLYSDYGGEPGCRRKKWLSRKPSHPGLGYTHEYLLNLWMRGKANYYTPQHTARLRQLLALMEKYPNAEILGQFMEENARFNHCDESELPPLRFNVDGEAKVINMGDCIQKADDAVLAVTTISDDEPTVPQRREHWFLPKAQNEMVFMPEKGFLRSFLATLF